MSFACLAFWSEIHNNQQCCTGAWLPLEVMTLALLVQCTLRTTRGLSHQSTVMLKQAEGKDLRLLVILSSSVTSCLASTEKKYNFLSPSYMRSKDMSLEWFYGGRKGNKGEHSTVKNHHNYFKPLLNDILFLTAETVLFPQKYWTISKRYDGVFKKGLFLFPCKVIPVRYPYFSFEM